MRFIFHVWDFINVGTLFVGKDIISAIIFIGCTFSGVTIIYYFELLVDYFDFIDRVELSSISCGEKKIFIGANLFGSIETLFVLMSIGIFIMDFSLVLEFFFN